MKKPIKLLLMCIFIANCINLNAQSNVEQAENPQMEVITGTFLGEVGPLRDIKPERGSVEDDGTRTVNRKQLNDLLFERNASMKVRNYPFLATALPKGPDPVWQKDFVNSRSTPIIVQNFPAQNTTMFPPDCNGAVGPNHFMQTINVSFTIYDKSGSLLVGPLNMNTLFAGVVGSGCNDGDPIILYDEVAQRWLAAEFSICGSNDYMLVAVSTTSDPTGSWYAYSFDVDDLPDYPKFGVWQDGYYLATNNMNKKDIYVLERSVMLAGGSNPKMVGFVNPLSTRPNSGFHCLMPLDNDWEYAPAGTPGLFITINDDAWGGSDQLWIYELKVNWSNTSASTFSRVQTLNVPSFDSHFGSNWNDIPQPGTTQRLDAIPQVLMFRAQYLHQGGVETIVCNHTVDVNNAPQAGIRWYELTRPAGTSTWSLRQTGTYAPDANSRWCAGISMNKNREIGLAYSIVGSSVYPGIRFTGQSAAEWANASGIMDIAETQVVAGTGVQSSYNRWGDYTQMSVDPIDNTTFWLTTQYSKGGANKGTQVIAFKFQDAGNPTLTATAMSKTQIDLSWVKNSNNDPVLVAWSATGNFGTPANGTTYSAGQSLPGGGTVLYYGPNTSFNHTGLTASTTYYYKAYSYASNTYTSGVTAEATTYCCEEFTMDFEACTDYSTNFLPWIAVDVDGLSTYGSNDFVFPGETQPFAFMAFNPSDAAIATPITLANGGLRCGMAISPSNQSQADDWFISNKISLGTNSSFSLWVKTVKDDWGLEDYEILVSTTNTNPSSFTVISGGANQQAPATWTQRTYDLSPWNNQQVHVAVRYRSVDKFMFLIDDLVISTSTSGMPIADFTAAQTSLCQGNQVQFNNASTNASNYSWTFTGGTPSTSTAENPTVTYNTAGTYSVTLTVTNSSGSDVKTMTNYITVNSNPTVDLGGNQSTCAGASITLNAQNTGATYLWSTGATTQTINVTTAGTYAVTVTSNGCTATDQVNVAFNNNITVNLGSNKILCQGSSLILDAQNQGYSYLWSTGATSQTITVTNSGTYSVTVTQSSQCTGVGSVVVTSAPTYSNTVNTNICEGESVLINGTWVSTPGTYHSNYFSSLGCDSTITTILTVTDMPYNVLDIDTLVCNDETIVLYAGVGQSYLWSTGATSQTIIADANTYGLGTTSFTVTVSNGNCSEVGTASVNFEVCSSVKLEGTDINFRVFPNPTNGIMSLELYTSSIEEITIDFISETGKLLTSDKTQTSGILKRDYRLSRYPAGIYYIRISNGKSEAIQKIIKQ